VEGVPRGVSCLLGGGFGYGSFYVIIHRLSNNSIVVATVIITVLRKFLVGTGLGFYVLCYYVDIGGFLMLVFVVCVLPTNYYYCAVECGYFGGVEKPKRAPFSGVSLAPQWTMLP